MKPEIKESHLREYLIAVCEDFFVDYKEQHQCSDGEVMSAVLSALASTCSAMAEMVKEF